MYESSGGALESPVGERIILEAGMTMVRAAIAQETSRWPHAVVWV